MSRVIKFRVWDSRFNKYLKLDGGVVMHPESGNIHGIHSAGNVEHWHLQQFTGLTDKNGVQIYEGDIIRYVRKSTIETITRPVIFKDAGFMVEESEMCDMPLCGICSDESHEGSHVGFVIGNIYQNPELLK